MSSPIGFKSLSKSTYYAIIFSIGVGISLIVDYTLFEFVTLPPESDDTLLSYYWIDPSFIIFDIIEWGLYIGSMVTFFWWIYRANKNIHTFGARDVYSPTMSVIWFFIPLLNLRNGYQSLRQIWSASNTSINLTDGLEWKFSSISLRTVKIWWFIVAWIPFLVILFLIFLTPFVISSPISDASISEAPELESSISYSQSSYSFTVIILASILVVISLVLYIEIIRKVSEWQELKGKFVQQK